MPLTAKLVKLALVSDASADVLANNELRGINVLWRDHVLGPTEWRGMGHQVLGPLSEQPVLGTGRVCAARE